VGIKDLASRLTGISTPAGGASWKSIVTEKEVAMKLFSYLEDRRVLFELGEAESPHHAIASILEMRQFLTDILQQTTNDNLTITDNVRALRAGCREFLSNLEKRGATPGDMRSPGHWASWEFLNELGKLRAGFGIHIAVIADRYGAPIPRSLQVILPPAVD
jgi:hypothetical protein